MARIDPYPTTPDGYLDRRAVKKALGPKGPQMLVSGDPLPRERHYPVLAKLLGVKAEKVAEVVDREREVRRAYDQMLSSCRSMPYTLLTWEQMSAGRPCPGCGRPWLGDDDGLDRTDEWQRLHGQCQASTTGFSGAPRHCKPLLRLPADQPRDPGQHRQDPRRRRGPPTSRSEDPCGHVARD
jgi:hypothetical protein